MKNKLFFLIKTKVRIYSSVEKNVWIQNNQIVFISFSMERHKGQVLYRQNERIDDANDE